MRRKSSGGVMLWTALLALFGAVSGRTVLGSPSQKRHTIRTYTNVSEDFAQPSANIQQRDESPCKPFLDEVAASNDVWAYVDGVAAKTCLDAVLVDQSTIDAHIDSLKRALQWQSTLTLLKDSEMMSRLQLQPVDLLAGLDDILADVKSGKITGQLDLETKISMLFRGCHDEHLKVEGNLMAGPLSWLRGRYSLLVSITEPDKEPSINLIYDMRAGKFNPVTKINGVDAMKYIKDDAESNLPQDPHARYNEQFFYENYAGTDSYFAAPKFYPGPEIEVTFTDGTVQKDKTRALVKVVDWKGLTTPEDIYDRFVRAGGQIPGVQRRDTADDKAGRETAVRRFFKLDERQSSDAFDPLSASASTPPGTLARSETLGNVSIALSRRDLPSAIVHGNSRLQISANFIRMGDGTPVAVFRISSFEDKTDETRKIIDQLVKISADQNIDRLIIDLRHNHGGTKGNEDYLTNAIHPMPLGKVELRRFRSHKAVRNIGNIYERFRDMSSQQFIMAAVIANQWLADADGNLFPSWKSVYGPVQVGDDTFSVKYEWKFPGSSQDPNGVAPFPFANIAILSDGVCASACAAFINGIKLAQPDIHVLAVGGDPSNKDPMAAAGSTKGTFALFLSSLATYGEYAAKRLQSSSSDYLPTRSPLQIANGGVNFEDTLLAPDFDTPIHFIRDPADCRFPFTWLTNKDVTALWRQVYDIALAGSPDPGSDSDPDEQFRHTACVIQ